MELVLLVQKCGMIITEKDHNTSGTLHYFSDDWNLVSKLLLTYDIPDEAKTGTNIRKELNHWFTKWELSTDCLENITFVTDRGANSITNTL